MKKYVLIIFILFPITIYAQFISTFAGGGLGGLGDGGPATAAIVPDPIGGVFDKYGNYYCAEGTEQIVRKIDNFGIITTFAGISSLSGFSGDHGPATAAELFTPTAIRIDPFGNFYICDANNNRIRKVDASTGIITTVVGSSSTAGFGGDNGPASAALLSTPSDICFDTLGNLYIADGANHRIRKVDTSGIITTVAGTGISGSTGDYGPATIARIQFPEGLAIDDTGNLYVSGLDHLVRKINSVGIISTVAGVSGMYSYPGDGILATNAPIYPIKLAIDYLGRLVIADDLNHRVFRVDNAGIIHTIAGNGMTGFGGDGVPATATSLDYPSGVAFDSCGNLYITEANNGRVRKVTFDTSCGFQGGPLSVSNLAQKSEIRIYPNPANDLLQVENAPENAAFQLFNFMGSTVLSGILQKNNCYFSIQSLPPGVYVLELIDDEGNKTIRKIIKQ